MKLSTIIASVTTAICALIILIMWPFAVVAPGHVGVVVMLGKTNSQALEPGFSVINPLASVHEISVQVQKSEAKGQAASKDLQKVYTTLTLNYHLRPSSVVQLYNEVGMDFEAKLIDPALQDSFKGAAAAYTAEELIAKREDIRIAIRELVAKKLATATNNAVIVDDVFITNFSFSDEFEQAIERKTTAEQNALTEKNKLAIVQYQAQQAVETAKGEAQAMAAKRVQATPEYIKLKELEVQSAAIERWDGKLPNQMLGNTMPFLSVNR